MTPPTAAPGRIAVIGTGIAGMSAAWLLAHRHHVTVFEADTRIGGHSHTVQVAGCDGTMQPVDTGFIVYNAATYPNLVALFAHLGVATQPSDMSFAVSARAGRMEYGGGSLAALFAQPVNLLRPRFLRMLADTLRFFRVAPVDLAGLGDSLLSLGDYLDGRGFSRAFQDDHLLPMAAAIWSCPRGTVRDQPAVAFIRFCETHGLLRLAGRPQWRTVAGGSCEYVQRLTAGYAGGIRTSAALRAIRREPHRVVIEDRSGHTDVFDDVVLACHADQALALLADPDAQERALLGAFRYAANQAVLHTDRRLMPRRRAVWSSWNFIADDFGDSEGPCVSYWMNRLQSLPPVPELFLTLNPSCPPDPAAVIRRDRYEHPVFDALAIRAQRALWTLQGRRRSWFCGAYFGAGFHEDALQSGLAVAEALGGVRRPWQVADESGRIHLQPIAAPALPAAA